MFHIFVVLRIFCFTGSYYLVCVYVSGANKGPIVCPEADSNARHKDLFFGHVIRVFLQDFLLSCMKKRVSNRFGVCKFA